MNTKLINLYLSILFCFAFSFAQGQEYFVDSSEISTESNITSINWKPFTLELNSSGLGHGFSLEKSIFNNVSLRTGFAGELKSKSHDNLAYKFHFGILSSFINEGNFSLRTGIELGIRNIKVDNYYHPLIDFIAPPGSTTITTGFIDLPLLMQYRISETISFDVGVKTVFQNLINTSNVTSVGRPFSEPYYELETRVTTYHLGIRYTFDK